MSTLLEVFGIDWRLLLLQTANFGILVAALTILLYKPVMKIVRERAQVVAKGVEDAEAAAAHLAAADRDAGAALGPADHEAARVRRESEKEIARFALLAAEKLMRKKI